jgi:thioredoxin:protein disulfide reductase
MHQRCYIVALGLLLGLSSGAFAAAQDDLLPPEQAFAISAQAQADAATVTWDIANGYYLYRSKIHFRTDDGGVELGDPQLPQAITKQDPLFGEVQIYRGRLMVRVPLTRTGGGESALSLEAQYQGCADLGVCYPPQRRTLHLRLPPISSPASAPRGPLVSAIAPAAATTSRASDAALSPLAELDRDLGIEAGDTILQPDEAYHFSASVENPTQLRLIWTIASGTYLYRDKLRISLEAPSEVRIGPFQLPRGTLKKDTIRPDGSIGDEEIYYDGIDLHVPLLRSAPEATRVALVAHYQGCAERGICYPPITKKVALDLPAVAIGSARPPPATPGAAPRTPTGTAAPEPVATLGPLAEQDRIAASLRQGSVWGAIVSFFGLGLLLAFTPCIFPMIPILSGIIAGHGRHMSTARAFWLSLVYVLAMAATYTLAGVLAGLFGQNIQAAFQDPWILSAFALLFVALALSMFGFYDLQLPAALQTRIVEISNRQQGGSLVGVAIMGLLSALIVGPCVAPPLAGALIYIGQTGDALLGGLALFALGLGMGAPLIVIGTSAGKLLPRAGAWMDAVKAVFGVLLLGVAISLLERILSAPLSMALWGLLLICSAIYMGALRDLPVEASGWSKLWKGLGVALLIYGSLMLVGAAGGGGDTLQPLRGLAMAGSGSAPSRLDFRPVSSLADLDRELAGAGGRPVLLDFYADWCVSCKELDRYTFSAPEVQRVLAGYRLLRADVTANTADDRALLQGRFGLPGPPAIIFYGPDGSERPSLRVVGFVAASELVSHAQEALR